MRKRIRLLNDNGYIGMGDVVFPVEVEAEIDCCYAYVPREELYRIGPKPYFDTLASYRFPRQCWGIAE